MYYSEIMPIDGDIDLTIKKLRELRPDINWQIGYSDHDLGGYYSVCVDDEAEDYDEDLIYKIEHYFNKKEFDEIERL